MQDKKLTISADCALVVNKEISEKFGKEALIIGCPMLEDPRRMFEKIRLIVDESSAEEIEIFSMEVPCCQAIHMMVEKANEERKEKGKSEIKVTRKIVRVNGETEEYTGEVDESMLQAEIKAHRGG
ncbi:hypothetical protein [Archaeoglobus sulfaticallidus]|nr:hypothetical protein [Archaeoglobus sulfaticallidus]